MKTVTGKEAQESLSSIRQTQQQVDHSMRAPIWLIVLMSFFFGLLTWSSMKEIDNDFYSWVVWGSLIAMILCIQLWSWLLKRRGMSMKYWPRTPKGKLLFFGQIVIYGCIILGGSFLYGLGYAWVPGTAAVVNFGLCGYFLYHFPSSEWTDK